MGLRIVASAEIEERWGRRSASSVAYCLMHFPNVLAHERVTNPHFSNAQLRERCMQMAKLEAERATDPWAEEIVVSAAAWMCDKFLGAEQ